MKKALTLLLLLFLAVSTSSCLFDDRPQVKNYYEEEISYVFSKFIEKEDKFIYRLDLNHPLRLTQKQMDKIMLSLKYAPNNSFYDVFSSDTDSVFDNQTIIDIAPQFRQKLVRLQPEEKLVFAIVDQQERTSGEVFVIGNGIHWRFDYIKGVPYIENQEAILDWIAPWSEEEENFRLLAGKRQFYHKTHKEMPRAGNRNWIIVPIGNKALTKKDDVLVDYYVRLSMESDKAGTQKIITNKLMMLEKEYEGGVLSYHDYNKRREYILDSLE